MVAKKMNVPDIGSLLGKIAEKRDSGELPRTEVQRVQPVEVSQSPEIANITRKDVKTPKRENQTQQVFDDRSAGGRPSAKEQGVEYARLSSKIPKSLKRRVEIAMLEERFQDAKGRTITTFDELVALAFERLVSEKK